MSESLAPFVFMNLKKLDKTISYLSRDAKKKLLAKYIDMTNDNFIWLEPTQKEICNIDEIPEIPEQTSEIVRLFIRLTTRGNSI